jgi:hypothetical protein
MSQLYLGYDRYPRFRLLYGYVVTVRHTETPLRMFDSRCEIWESIIKRKIVYQAYLFCPLYTYALVTLD